jgi:hypothetical protein
MTQCTYPGCPAIAVAKGLCTKHYMRLRRHGDAGTVKKAGPKNDPWIAKVHLNWTDISKRSRQRFIHAVRLLKAYDIDPAPLIAHASRANGSLNAASLEEMAEIAVASLRIEREESADPDLPRGEDGE